MPRSHKSAKGGRAPSRKAANSLGYARRQTLKSKTLSRDAVSDVYEYESEKVRRSKVKLQVDKDELLGMTPGSDEDQDDSITTRRGKAAQPRLVGEKDDDDRIDEDEDEEIDSDEAFEESDEERFAGFNFSHSKKSKSSSKSQQPKQRSAAKARQPEVDLNEDEDVGMHSQEEEESDKEEEEEEEGNASDFFDVLDIMDGRGPPPKDAEVDDTARRAIEQSQAQRDIPDVPEADTVEDYDAKSDASQEEESEVEDEDSDQVISASEVEDDEDVDALGHLQNFVTTLDAGQKRKASEGDTEDTEATRPRKRRILKEKTEAGAENEFAAHTGGGKLKLDDLLAPLAGRSSNLLSLKKSAKVLASSAGSAQTLSAPLPQRTAERLDREAAYEQTKEEVDKWKATMQRIRDAEHLSFPLQAQPAGKTSNLELAAKFKPSTELESAVDKLLKSAKMREEEIAQTESLKMNHLSMEEVTARRAELAKMRELMFRAEAKAKRVAKIKSKTYRRLKKKEKARLAAKLGEDEDAEDEDDEEVRMKREIERARERATLRHKNTGKWAKAMKARGELDEDQRQDIQEMLDRGEKLRRKIRGDGESDDEDESDDNSDEDDEGAEQRIKASAFEELAGLQDSGSLPEAGSKKGKSIFEMKFMQDAMAKQQRHVDEMVDDFVKEMGGAVPEEGTEGAEDEVQQHSYGTVVERVGGRVMYRPGAPHSSLRPVDSLASDTSSVTLKSTDFPPSPQVESLPPQSPEVQRHAPLSLTESNPWLAPHADEPSKAVQKKHEVVVGKNSAALEKSKNKLRKQTKKRGEEKEKAKDDATVDISMTDVITLGAVSTAAGPSKQKAPAASSTSPTAQSHARRSRDDDDESDVNSEVEEQEKALNRKGKGKGKANGVTAFQQRDLVALAFAGDNVVREFAEEKRREMQEDAPREVDTTLPGWGAWGGKGAKKAPPKPHLIKKVAGIDPSSRADYKKAHVIISEKRDKKAAKYQVKDLPYPYTSQAQFERKMEAPIGTEWNTRLAFQRATLPKVVKKMGTVISPLEKVL
ncbi:Utp14-domain-containing protein [Obba rivulosa]|uniref:Utp14-domain-containing protein n=1 Tax=Obba rivulosa TaxID=1052685 RepID=A0A8E2DU48_9APHY|nr:Utp14-domain-containing protein [Obba rivulosa]